MKDFLLPGLLVVLGATGCVRNSSVVRVFDGQKEHGRYVTFRAYAAYARGAYLEARGDLDGAGDAYQNAVQSDPHSAQVWTRLGAIRCKKKRADAHLAFERALEIEPSYEPAWRERARCAADSNDLAAAVEFAELASKLDPNRLETTLLLASIYERASRPKDARRWLEALTVNQPRSRPAWQAVLAHATRFEIAQLRARAIERLAALGEETSGSVSASVDRALGTRDLDRARALALRARLAPGTLAVRAAAMGLGTEARAEADLVLGADPSNSDARIAGLVAADLLRDPVGFERFLGGLDADPVAPSPLAARLMAELLERRIGHDARRDWLELLGELPPPTDPLELAVTLRSTPTKLPPETQPTAPPAPSPKSP